MEGTMSNGRRLIAGLSSASLVLLLVSCLSGSSEQKQPAQPSPQTSETQYRETPVPADQPPAQPAIKANCTRNSFTINGISISFPCPKAKLISLLGQPERSTSFPANEIATWDTKGIIAFATPGKSSYHTISFFFKPSSFSLAYSPRAIFSGELSVDKHRISAIMTRDQLMGLGFEPDALGLGCQKNLGKVFVFFDTSEIPIGALSSVEVMSATTNENNKM
jgi:hypothetical protein